MCLMQTTWTPLIAVVVNSVKLCWNIFLKKKKKNEAKCIELLALHIFKSGYNFLDQPNFCRISLAPLALRLGSLPKLKMERFLLAQVHGHLDSREYWCDFSATHLMMAALIISQNQASHSCNKSRLFYLVQTPVKFTFGQCTCTVSHSQTWGKRIICVCVSRVCSRTKDFWVLLSFLHCCHLMAPKPTGRSWAVRWGWGRSASSQGAGLLPPWPGTSSVLPAPQDSEEPPECLFRAEQSKWCLSALLQDWTCPESVLNYFTKHLLEVGNGISDLSRNFQFSS